MRLNIKFSGLAPHLSSSIYSYHKSNRHPGEINALGAPSNDWIFFGYIPMIDKPWLISYLSYEHY